MECYIYITHFPALSPRRFEVSRLITLHKRLGENKPIYIFTWLKHFYWHIDLTSSLRLNVHGRLPSTVPILSDFHWYFGHGLKICMCFGYNPQIFILLFSQVELSHISSIIYNKVTEQRITCERNSSCSFIPILSNFHWYFGHGLRLCMWFGYNPRIIFII